LEFFTDDWLAGAALIRASASLAASLTVSRS